MAESYNNIGELFCSALPRCHSISSQINASLPFPPPGLLLYSQGALASAIPLYEKALEIKLTAFGTTNPSVATSMFNLAALYHRMGALDQAMHYYQQAYDIR